jgi:hypothetical protein
VDFHRPARLLHGQEEAHRHRHDEEIDDHGAEKEQQRRRHQIGHEGAPLVLVEAGRDELVDLAGDDGKRKTEGAEQGELHLREQEFLRRRVDHLDRTTGGAALRPQVGQHQDVVDLLGEDEADRERDADGDQRPDQARAQLDEVIEERRLGGVDIVLAGTFHDVAHAAPLSGSFAGSVGAGSAFSSGGSAAGGSDVDAALMPNFGASTSTRDASI